MGPTVRRREMMASATDAEALVTLSENAKAPEQGGPKISNSPFCCDIGQIDIFSRIELIPSFVLSSDNTNCKNDIQLFHQLFDEHRVNRDYH